MPDSKTILEAVKKFSQHYADFHRLGPVKIEPEENANQYKYSISSEKLRGEGNLPMIFSHGEKTRDVIVLTHGLTDSPYYMQAIGERFYAEGFNVILPLLPAHGLKDPDEAMDDRLLNEKWPQEIDQAVGVAQSLGDRVSLGGFSTGGALSLNKILKEPKEITGGLFLFSAAIDLGFADNIACSNFLAHALQFVLERKEGKLAGNGPNPFKYPELPKSTGIELCQVVHENELRLSEQKDQGRKISQPVFAAHSVHDKTIEISNSKGIIELLTNHVTDGLLFLISQKVDRQRQDIEEEENYVRHEEVVLAKKIDLQQDLLVKWPKMIQPLPNPKFQLMMDTAIHFFNNYIMGRIC